MDPSGTMAHSTIPLYHFNIYRKFAVVDTAQVYEFDMTSPALVAAFTRDGNNEIQFKR